MVPLQPTMDGGRSTTGPLTGQLPLWGKLVTALAVISLLFTAFPIRALADEWEPVSEGIDYREFTDIPSQRIFVARMERDNPVVTLETSLGNRQLFEGKDTVSQMAERYDESLSGWEPAWGSRMDIKVAINGSFHDLETGRPQSGMVQAGWYIKRFNSLGGGSGFGWTLDRRAIVGGCVNHRPEEQLITSLRTGKSRQILLVNDSRGNGIPLYTTQYGRRTAARGSPKVLIQMESPLTILPYPDMVYGVVKEVREERRPVGIPFDHVVLGPDGSDARWVRENLHVGDRVGFSISLDHFKEDCRTPNPVSWSETYAAISGSFEFLQDGDIHPHDDDLGARNRNPRTAICYEQEYLYFIVVDGRADGRIGMTMQELGEFCRDRLEADWGINLDGGGSSAMWVDGEIVNRPSDGNERAVANGIMMVEIEPMERSSTFLPGDHVSASELIDLSVGPGTNYQTPHDVREGDEGTILAHEHSLEGVLSTGSYWWLVDFDGKTGWAREDSLDLLERPDPVPQKTPAPSSVSPRSTLFRIQSLWERASSLVPLRWPDW